MMGKLLRRQNVNLKKTNMKNKIQKTNWGDKRKLKSLLRQINEEMTKTPKYQEEKNMLNKEKEGDEGERRILRSENNKRITCC